MPKRFSGCVVSFSFINIKDGRYAYKYKDINGTTKFLYSWKLVKTDRVPAGKRECTSLREMIVELNRNLESGIDTKGKQMTVSELYTLHNANNANVKPNTKTGRKYLQKHLDEDVLGKIPIHKVTVSIAKAWTIRANEKFRYSYGKIKNYQRSLIATFYTAINDGLININPFNFKLSDVIPNDTKQKEALSENQVEMLLNYIENHKRYGRVYRDTVILLNTGLRISELCGLTIDDVDFDN